MDTRLNLLVDMDIEAGFCCGPHRIHRPRDRNRDGM